MNLAFLSGNVGGEPNVHTFEDGNKEVTFSLATSKRGYTKQDGTEIPERTTWHTIVCRGSLATFAEKYVNKGRKYIVIGEITNREYTDNNGIKRKVSEIAANSVEFCDAPNSTQEQGNAPTTPANGQQMPFNPKPMSKKMAQAVKTMQERGFEQQQSDIPF